MIFGFAEILGTLIIEIRADFVGRAFLKICGNGPPAAIPFRLDLVEEFVDLREARGESTKKLVLLCPFLNIFRM